MTNEQHIENLKKLKSYHNGSYGSDIDKAIKALEQESCDDAISRQAVLELVADYDLSMGQVVKCIHDLPPVTPKPKTGHWIEYDHGLNAKYYQCSICKGFDGGAKGKYCKWCGAKMVEQERSDEE